MIELIRPGDLIILSLILLLNCRFASAEPDPLVIEFLKNRVAFSGAVDSKETADTIAAEVLLARPDLDIVNSGLVFDATVKLPNLKLLSNLVVEIALSTHEGVFEISKESLMVGGLTDSVVTTSVLRLRSEPVLENRRFREQVCLVPSVDLPEIPIVLSTGEIRKAFSFDLELQQKEEVSFEPPGIILTKLLNLIEGTADAGLYPPVVVEPVKIETPEPPKEIPPVAPEMTLAPVTVAPPPPPPSPYEEFGPITFVRNGVILQAGQAEMLEQLIPLLKQEPWSGKPIIVRSLIYQSNSKAFTRWNGERRLNEAVRLLKEAGIPAGLLRPETAEVPDRIDRGEVKLMILKPPGYISPPEPGTEEVPE